MRNKKHIMYTHRMCVVSFLLSHIFCQRHLTAAHGASQCSKVLRSTMRSSQDGADRRYDPKEIKQHTFGESTLCVSYCT